MANSIDIKFHLLETSTNNFSDELKVGSGGYGDVYKGVYNGEDIAVKKLHQLQGLDDSAFDNEFRNLTKAIENWERRLQGTLTPYSSHQKYILQVKKCVEISLKCVEKDRKKRPCIEDIVHELHELEADLSKDRIGQTSSDSKVLAVDPTELRFIFELRKDIRTCLLLTNKTDGFIAFHVDTNETKYCTEPNKGIMGPCSWRYISVKLLAQDEAPPNMRCNDKFHVQSVHVSEELTSHIVTEDFFEEVMAGKVLDIVRLPIVYVASDQFRH